MACDCSGLVCGLFRLLDVEIRLAVEPFMLWEQGDSCPFLRAMPSMCALIALGYKPKVSKVVLMALERMAGYLRDHPKLVDHVAVNCTLFDEEKVEFLNAKIGRWFNARTPNSGIEQYTMVTSIMKGIEEIQRSLDELLIKRKTQATENERLRTAYLSPSWTETHEKFEAFVLGRFEAALNEAKPAAEAEDRFAAGLVKIDDKYLPELPRPTNLAWRRGRGYLMTSSSIKHVLALVISRIKNNAMCTAIATDKTLLTLVARSRLGSAFRSAACLESSGRRLSKRVS